mgnify:CR=1 FL=1
MTQSGASVKQSEPKADKGQTTFVSGASARKAAQLFNIGNIVAILLPLPLGLLWLGGSMIIYAMNRHHPNQRVGHYTQQAAYRFYGVTGFFVAIATFIPGNGWKWYLIAWALAALVIIPWSILDIVRIRRENWQDVAINQESDL